MRDNLHSRNSRSQNQRLLRQVLFHMAQFPPWIGLRPDCCVSRGSVTDRNGASVCWPERQVLAAHQRPITGYWGISGRGSNRGQGLRHAALPWRVGSLSTRRLAQADCGGARAVWSWNVWAFRNARHPGASANHGVLYSSKSVARISVARHGQKIQIRVRARRTRLVAAIARPEHSGQAGDLGWGIWSWTVAYTQELLVARRPVKFADVVQPLSKLAGSQRNPKTKLVGIC